MGRRSDEKTVRIVPLGGVAPETVAEFAHGLKRLAGCPVEVSAPRRLGIAGVAGLLDAGRLPDGRGGELTLGIAAGDTESVVTDAARGVGVVVLPEQRAVGALARVLRRALAGLGAHAGRGPMPAKAA
jgi:hypothetical protein